MSEVLFKNVQVTNAGGTNTYSVRDSHINVAYAECTTAAATQAKVATVTNDPSWELRAGSLVSVKFTYNVPANATLQIGSTDAKSIYFHGAAIKADIIAAGDTATFMYDGIRYILTSMDSSMSSVDFMDMAVIIQQNSWTENEGVYTYTWTNEHLTANSIVQVEFKDGVRGGLVGDLKAQKTTGQIVFTTNLEPVGAIPLNVRIIDAVVEHTYPIAADLISTDAVTGQTEVQGALEEIVSKQTADENNIATLESYTGCDYDDYDPEELYHIGDRVAYNGKVYECLSVQPVAGGISNSNYFKEVDSLQDQIDDGFSNIKEVIADDFDSTNTYAAGDYCFYQGILYRCLGENTAPHLNAFNGYLWETVSVSYAIKENNQAIAELKENDAVFIGDSYSVTETGYTSPLPTLLKNRFGFETIYNYAIAGAGYVNGSGTNQHFGGQLSSAISELTAVQKSKVRFVFILGGQNDYAQTVNDIVTELGTIFDNAHSAFPNAKIVALPLWRNSALSKDNSLRFPVIYYYAIQKKCITDASSWAYLINTLTTMMDDGVHPSQASLSYLATCIYNAVYGNKVILPLSGSVVQKNNDINITYYNPTATFDGENVTFRAIFTIPSNSIAANTQIFKVHPAYVPIETAYFYASNSAGNPILFTVTTNGKISSSNLLPSGATLGISFTWSLFNTTMTNIS